MEALLDRLRRLRGGRADLAAAGLGLVSALALPPLHALPALWLAVPGLLALIDGTGRPAVAFRRGFLFALLHHMVGLYWVTEAILFEAARFWWLVPLAVPALAVLLAVFIAFPCAIARHATPGLPRLLALAGAWVLFDLLRQFVLGGFPWNPWGADWAIPGRGGDVFIQPAAWVGVGGLTLFTLLLAAGPAFGRSGWTAALLGVLAWIAAGQARLVGVLGAEAGPPPGLAVVLVQGNIRQGQKFDRAFAAETFQRHLALTRAGVSHAGDLPYVVVWPETASPYLLTQDPPARAAIAAAAAGPGFRGALVGAVRFDAQGLPRNSLLALDPDGAVVADYDKWHLVPFGEYSPGWMPLPVQVVPGHGFGAGDGALTLHPPGLPALGPLICYEAIFSGQVADPADRPAWLVNVTNDSWFGNSSGPRQHLAAARLRAVEQGLPLMRAANSGITAGFDAHGHELARLPMNQAGTLVLELPGRLHTPLFARLGLGMPLALGALALGFGLRAPGWLRRRG